MSSEEATAWAKREAAMRKVREESDYMALEPEDFGAGVADTREPRGAKRGWSKTKRQEFSAMMAEYLPVLRGTASPEELDRVARYHRRLAEEERRFGKRRVARSLSLAAAHEALHTFNFLLGAKKYFGGIIQPTKWLRKPRKDQFKRTIVALLSDLHLGADLSPLDNPIPFGPVEEARRLEKVVREIADYKPHYRCDTDLVLLINGDVIEGNLQHDNTRDEAPVPEQELIFLHLMGDALGYLADAFRDTRIRVVCQPGNHGRDKQIHPGRATRSKWKGTEWKLYRVLEMMCQRLPNVTFDVPFMAVSTVDLHGAKMGVSHGDTEVPIKHPDSGSGWNAAQLAQINSNRRYGVEYDVWAFGHYHACRIVPGRPWRMHNGALIPSPGYSRGMTGTDEGCVQLIWEAVPGYPVGDVRPIDVGPAQDHDKTLGKIIRPFRLPEKP
jgi:hypothetical protein